MSNSRLKPKDWTLSWEKRLLALMNYEYLSQASLTLLHSEWSKLHRVLAILSAIWLSFWLLMSVFA